MRNLLAKHPFPPLDVIIPILEQSGQGGQELATHIYNVDTTLITELKEVLNLKDTDMRTLAKVWEYICSFEGWKFQPIELNESTFSFSIPQCPMLRVGKDVNPSVKSKYCDLICTAGRTAIMDAVLGRGRATFSRDKALIKGAGKCTVTFTLVKP